jgi:hypothetical protein
MDEAEFQASYPVIFDILDSTIRPGVDGCNLLELLHRILIRAHPQQAQALVEEFDRLWQDRSFTAAELTEIFNRDVPALCALMHQSTATAVIFSLAKYLRYVYQHEKLG